MRKFWKALGFPEAPLNPAGKVALREIEEIVETARVRKGAIDLLLAADMRKHLGYSNHSL